MAYERQHGMVTIRYGHVLEPSENYTFMTGSQAAARLKKALNERKQGVKRRRQEADIFSNGFYDATHQGGAI